MCHQFDLPGRTIVSPSEPGGPESGQYDGRIPPASARSYLYVPGDRPDRFAKALASGADAVILDLEDAVSIGAKADARAAVADLIGGGAAVDQVEVWVRINTGDAGLEDLEMLRRVTARHLAGLVVPKATPTWLANVGAAVSQVPLCALVESARGLLELPAISGTEGVVVLALGEVDLVADIGVNPTADLHALWPLRMNVVVASAAFDLAAPIGPVDVNVGDLESFRSSTVDLLRAGFGGRQVIHPAQVAIVNEVMTPTAEELSAAARLIEAAEAAGVGAFTDDAGRMVDEAVLRSARRTISRAR